jgi:Mrp family chromosome partitioning ATPase
MTGLDRSFIRAFKQEDVKPQAPKVAAAHEAASPPNSPEEATQTKSGAVIEIPLSQVDRSDGASHDEGMVTLRFDVPAELLSKANRPHFLGTASARDSDSPRHPNAPVDTAIAENPSVFDEPDTSVEPNSTSGVGDASTIEDAELTDANGLRPEPDSMSDYMSSAGGGAVPTSTGEASIIRIDNAHKSVRDNSSEEAQMEQAVWTRPAFEVDQFAWPQVIQHITESAKTEIGRVADKVWSQAQAGRNVVSVAGCRPRQGRTTIALALAKRMAEMNLRVVVIDANLTNPSVATMLDVAAPLGWDDATASQLPVSEALIESMDDRLTIMPLREARSQAIMLKGEAGFPTVIAQVRSRFDVVLVDLPAIAAGRAPQLINRNTGIDWAILVRGTVGDEKGFRQLTKQFASLGVTPLGIVENEIENSASNY